MPAEPSYAHVLFPPAFGEGLHFAGGGGHFPIPLAPELGVAKPREDSRVKHLLEVLLRQGGAFHVSHGPDLFCQGASGRRRHGLLPIPRQLYEDLNIFTEVTLGAHQDKGCAGAVLADLGDPLFGDILEGGGADDAEAQDKHVCLGVAKVT
ncbi:hypothetical protein FKM82_025302 [Ascaphus truei]